MSATQGTYTSHHKQAVPMPTRTNEHTTWCTQIGHGMQRLAHRAHGARHRIQHDAIPRRQRMPIIYGRGLCSGGRWVFVHARWLGCDPRAAALLLDLVPWRGHSRAGDDRSARAALRHWCAWRRQVVWWVQTHSRSLRDEEDRTKGAATDWPSANPDEHTCNGSGGGGGGSLRLAMYARVFCLVFLVLRREARART